MTLILVMKGGNIIKSENHETLLNKTKWFYASLYNSQFENLAS